jgi:hypothetical protein
MVGPVRMALSTRATLVASRRRGDATKNRRAGGTCGREQERSAVTRRSTLMGNAERKSLESADETRPFPKGKAELVNIGGASIGRLTLEPGWRWSEHVKPIAGTEWCEAPHFQYHVSGRLHIAMADGTEFDAVPGDVTALPQGHDAWVVGDEPVVVVDWWGASNYARS